jgi:hypothetical protein
MDVALLQLFSVEEILQRLGEKEVTGALHLFTPRESANIFFAHGLIVGATKGLLEGDDVVRQVLDWKETRFVWQPDLSSSAAAVAKPMEISFPDLLLKIRATPKLEIGGKVVIPENASAPKPAHVSPASIRINIPIRAATTGSIQITPPTAPNPPASRTMPIEPAPLAPVVTPPLTSTKSILPVANSREAHEESLLRRYRLALVSNAQDPALRFRITRISSLIGRNPACDFSIDHGSVSRQHCLLQITDRGLHVKDLGTTNGTQINGIALTEGYINLGDKVTMGHYLFTLEKDEEPAEE